jgi:hypothetical protein
MFTFRFNPLFKQWVMVGGAVVTPQQIGAANLLDVGAGNGFQAASYPRQPFILEPKGETAEPGSLMHREEPAVGEYELLLYQGEQHFFSWDVAHWEHWLSLLQHRLRQLHHNPYLHFASVSLSTSALASVENYQRVGDLIAASHPLHGFLPLLSSELAERLQRKEPDFALFDDDRGRLYVPPAPLHDQEVWYLPATLSPGIDGLGAADRHQVAVVLSRLMHALHEEFPHRSYRMHLATELGGSQNDGTWWIQIYAEGPERALTVRTLPEAFLTKLALILGKNFLEAGN